MACQTDVLDKSSLEKFVKILAMKSAQIIVQARLGEKIKTDCNTKSSGNDWFNIAIDDQPDVLKETKKALEISQHESIVTRLPLCVEISLQTVEGDNMILEVWSLSVQKDQCDLQLRATHAIYNRMGLLLKSLLSVTRSTPAYKLSRRQSADSYQIFYRIYIGEPQTHQLGDGHKQLRVGQLCTQIGTLTMAVAFRTKMTISPTQTGRDNTIMLKSDHFLKDISPKHIRYNYNKKNEKKIIDLDKPMRCGAFVDASRVKQYTEEDFILPETPPFHWLLPKPKDDTISLKSGTDEDRQSINSPIADENSSTNANNNNTVTNLNNVNNNSNKGSFESAGAMNFRLSQSPKSGESNISAAATIATTATATTNPATGTNSGSPPASLTGEFRRSSRWSIRQTGPEDERLLKELHFPFAASNSPIGDLAKFYRECFNAPPLQEFNQLSNVISNVDDEEAANADDAGRILTAADGAGDEDDVDDLTRQLEQFETSLPEFETLVTSLCQTVDSNSNS
ncbi:autophagy-related protein 13 homolog isoform X1 [Wyeomyia smithii]|uniref:autophagy-related protein 13 homolog isoform X1 n=2 Tax=Wyeomyia smithii TaxID=174621 RepID=UPI002467ADFE|nr:autophagy-related protein 13 homolog isoform X1 [Wyeomyia smithii]